MESPSQSSSSYPSASRISDSNCYPQYSASLKCLEEFSTDKSKCQEYFDVYKECKKKEVVPYLAFMSFAQILVLVEASKQMFYENYKVGRGIDDFMETSTALGSEDSVYLSRSSNPWYPMIISYSVIYMMARGVLYVPMLLHASLRTVERKPQQL
ncbi:hypothetical protein C5167_029962 [Papaver somniferum]|nr:hypothetical protein C5167_029962 [Papaver somniferum]